jgi:hypothetical protein
MKERMPKTTPRPTPENPVGDAEGVNTVSVLLLPAFAIAIPHTPDISDVCKKYITSTAKIQDGSIRAFLRRRASKCYHVYKRIKMLMTATV